MSAVSQLKQDIRSRRISALKQAKLATASMTAVQPLTFSASDISKLTEKIIEYVNENKIRGVVPDHDKPYLNTMFLNLQSMLEHLSPTAEENKDDIEETLLSDLKGLKTKLARNRPPAFNELLTDLVPTQMNEGRQVHEIYEELEEKYPRNKKLYAQLYKVYSKMISDRLFRDWARSEAPFRGRKDLLDFVNQKVRDLVDFDDRELIQVTIAEFEGIFQKFKDEREDFYAKNKDILEKKKELGATDDDIRALASRRKIDDLIKDVTDGRHKPRKMFTDEEDTDEDEDEEPTPKSKPKPTPKRAPKVIIDKEKTREKAKKFKDMEATVRSEIEKTEKDTKMSAQKKSSFLKQLNETLEDIILEQRLLGVYEGEGNVQPTYTESKRGPADYGYKSLITPSQNTTLISKRKNKEHKSRLAKRAKPEFGHRVNATAQKKAGFSAVFPTTKKAGSTVGLSRFLDVPIPASGKKSLIKVKRGDPNFSLTLL